MYDILHLLSFQLCSQILSQGKGSGVDNTISLDVHAINELQEKKKVPPTNDKVKYNYTSDAKGNYRES